MKVTAVIVALLTLLQNFFTMIGFFPLKQTEIDYGGIPYEEPVIVEPMTIIKDGASEYRIVLSDSASVSERTAAEELQYYLREISGVTLPIVSDSTEPQGKEICLGQTSREGVFYTVDRSDLGDEGFILKVFDERLVIAGGALRGTLYGVYTFLEERLGVRWFTPDLTVIPEASEVIIDKQLEDKQVPVFEYRDDYWLSAYDGNWKPKQK
ncbi:MAG TPA: alpha-glucuronidase family glycosyl hydrolase, partial [Clostridiales bacterium]|nr:alpha-glucuronidase family glycosyl hydrolase [Clostridiales bacterium]